MGNSQDNSFSPLLTPGQKSKSLTSLEEVDCDVSTLLVTHGLTQSGNEETDNSLSGQKASSNDDHIEAQKDNEHSLSETPIQVNSSAGKCFSPIHPSWMDS